MFKRNVTRALSVMIASQLALSPAGAASQDATETIAAVMQGVSSVSNTVLTAMQQQAMLMSAQNQANMLKAEMNPQNCGTVNQPQACVSEIFPQCNILNTFPSLVEPGVCSDGIDGSDPNVGAGLAGVAAGYYAHFSLMEDEFMKKGLESNNTSNMGIGCLNAKADELARALKKREDEIDNLINKMQKEHDSFKRQAELDRNNIDEAMALLEGDNYKGRRGKAVLEQNSVRFADAFKNNAACGAVMSSEDFKKEGAKGFKGIEATLNANSNRKESGGYSAMEFNSTIANAIQADLQKMSEVLVRDISVKGEAALEQRNLDGLPSSYGLNKSPGVLAALLEQGKAAESNKSEIIAKMGELGVSDKDITDKLTNDRSNFDAALQAWERRVKNNCLASSGNIADLISKRMKLVDPNGSDFSSQNADNAFATFVSDTLRRSDITIEQKLSLITAEESRGGNNRFMVDVQKATSNNTTTEKSSSKQSASVFIKTRVENCVAQYQSNKNDEGFTQAEVASKLRSLRSEYMNYRKTFAGNVKNAVTSRVLNCQDNATANATGIATCSSRDLTVSSPNFCIKRANACAGNMRSCLNAAQEQVKKVTEARDKSVAQYRANMARHEDNLQKMYLLTENITSLDGLNIAASLKQQLVLPTNLKFHIDQDKRKLVQGLEAMEIQDPDEYFDLMKANLNQLKTKVAEQNRGVMNGLSDQGLANKESNAQGGVFGHIRNIRQNMETAMQRISQYKEQCKRAFDDYNRNAQQARQEALRAQQEQQNKQREFCTQYLAFQSQPGCESAENFDAIIRAGQQVGADSNQLSGLGQWRRYCRQFGSDNNQDVMSESTFTRSAGVGSMNEFCAAGDRSNDRNGPCYKLRNFSAACGSGSREDFVRVLTESGLSTDISSGWTENCATAPNTSSSDACARFRRSRISWCESNLQQTTQAVINRYSSTLAAAGGQSGAPQPPEGLGENRSAMCAAYDNSGANAIGKALNDVATQFGTQLTIGAGSGVR